MLSFFISRQPLSKQRASFCTINQQLTFRNRPCLHFFNQHISFQAAQMVNV